MARRREFCEEAVLDAAIKVFWQNGYECTSIADLEASTKLARGSIYKAFGDKHQFFVKAIKRYLAMMKAQVREVLTSNLSINDALRECTRLSKVESTAGVDGCFALNCRMEMAGRDDGIKQLLDNHYEYLERLLSERLQRAQDAGEVRTDITATELARMLMVWQIGLLAHAKSDVFTDDVEPLSERFLKLLAQ